MVGSGALRATATLLVALGSVGCGGSPGASPPPKTIETAAPGPSDDPDPGEVPRSEKTEPERAEEPSEITCTKPEQFGPVIVTEDQYARRRGARAARFSDEPTTLQQPIEECAVIGSLRRLLSLVCDDGSNPFRAPEAAHGSRAGNLGPGGRCGSVVDLYKVPCPEKTYDVHIDMYVCRDGQWPR